MAWETSFDRMNFGESSSIVRDIPSSCLLKMAKVEFKTSMNIEKTLSRVSLYLKISSFSGFLRGVYSTLFKVPQIITVNRTHCRFPFRIRFASSDIDTLQQIFLWHEYDVKVDAQPAVIVDAGANIGLAAIYFANVFPEAKIIAIEPEQGNFELLRENVAPCGAIIPLQAALWHKNEDIDLVDPGRGHWGFVTRGKEDGLGASESAQGAVCHRVRAITVDWLMDEYGLDRINILKIDIEGAEKEVFSDASAWIGKVDSMIVELHDHFKPGCLESFHEGAKGFDEEWSQGENVFVTKKGVLARRSA